MLRTNMRKIGFLFLFILFISVNVRAGGFKKYAGEFLNLGAGSRLTGMAGAGVAMINDASASYWNPAGLADARGLQIQFTHSKQFISSIQHDYLAISHPLKNNSTLGLSLYYFTVNGIKDSRQAYNEADDKVDYSKIKTFNTGDYVLFLSYGHKSTDDLQYGVNAKMIYRDFSLASAMGLGFDLGLQYRWFDQLRLGLMLKDVTTTMIAWSTGEKEFIPPSLRFGLSYLWNFSALNLSIQPAADFQVLFEGRKYASQLHLGAMSLDSFWGVEVNYKNVLTLRSGMDDLQRFNTGIGVSIPKVTFDYSFTAYQSELGNIHRITVRLFLDPLFKE